MSTDSLEKELEAITRKNLLTLKKFIKYIKEYLS